MSIWNLNTELPGLTASFESYTSQPLISQRGEAQLQEQMILLAKIFKILGVQML